MLLNDRITPKLTLILFLFTSGGLFANDPTTVPHWYLVPPNNTKSYYYGAGISQITFDKSIGYENAKKNAAGEILKSLKVRLRASYAGSQRSGHSEYARFVIEELDSSLVDKVKSNAMVLREVVHDNHVYVLICITKDYLKPKKSLSINLPLIPYDIPSKEKIPSWVDKKPRKKGFLYGISNTEPFKSQKESWEYSSKIARYEIASELSTEVKTITEDYLSGNQVFTKTLSEVNVNQILENTRIKGRWYDKSDYRFWTLIEYKLVD